MAKTRAQMNDLLSNNLGTAAAKITATRHREVETEMLEYVSGQILAAGETPSLDPNVVGIVVPLGITLPNTNYTIVGHFVSNGTSPQNDNNTVYEITQRTTNSYAITVLEYQGAFQQISFNWIAISTPGVSY